MVDVVVVGAGGHAKVIADLLRADDHQIVGCTDSRPGSGSVNGMTVLGPEDEVLPRLHADGLRHAFVALGDNALRRRVARLVANMGFEFVNAIGRSAVISPSARLATGCAVMEGAVINADAQIGPFAIINTNASIDHDCVVGAFAHIAPGSTLAGNVIVGEDAFLGAGVRVIPRISIGAGAVVGAGSVVVRALHGDATWVGVPAKRIGTKDKDRTR